MKKDKRIATVTRGFGIDMGHRLMKHEGKCSNVHGHRYSIEVTCSAPALDEVGRVIDFGDIKELVGAWLDLMFDHGFVAQIGDPIIPAIEKVDSKLLTLEVPPTVENLTRLWFEGASDILAKRGITVTKVKAFETPNCWAEYPG